MKDFELRITYSKEMEELHIRKSYYENDCCIDIKNIDDVKDAICEYLDDFVAEIEEE